MTKRNNEYDRKELYRVGSGPSGKETRTYGHGPGPSGKKQGSGPSGEEQQRLELSEENKSKKSTHIQKQKPIAGGQITFAAEAAKFKADKQRKAREETKTEIVTRPRR